jgi:hypothetical protein
MENDTKKTDGTPLSPLSVYNLAIKKMGAESVHDAIAKKGTDILHNKLPYVVQAARYQKSEKYKKSSRKREILTDMNNDKFPASDIWNPYKKIERNETLRIITECLAELPDEDVLAVWGKFDGLSDEKIRKQWIGLKIGPKNPKLSLIRKRRERALRRLRTMVNKRLCDTKSGKP